MKTWLASMAIAAFAAPGLAQTQPQRWVSFSLGTSQNDHSTVTVKGPGTDAQFHGVRWAMHPFESAPYYVVQLGQWSHKDPRWGLAVDFTHSKAIALTNQNVQAEGTWKGDPLPADMPLNTRLQRIRFTNGVNILSVVPVRRFAPPEARIQPYAGFGPAYFVIWSVVEADRIVRHARYHGDGQLGWQALTGVRGRLDNRLSWNFEVKWTSGAANVPVEPGMRLSTPIRTRHQTVGLAYSF